MILEYPIIVLYGNICRKPNIICAKSLISSRFSFITIHQNEFVLKTTCRGRSRRSKQLDGTLSYSLHQYICETFNCTGYTVLVTDSTMDYQWLSHINVVFRWIFPSFPRKFSHGMRCLLSKAWWRDWRRLRPWQMRRKNLWVHRMRTAARFLIWRCCWLFLLIFYGFSMEIWLFWDVLWIWKPVLKISGIFVSRLFGWDLNKYVCVCVWFKFKTHELQNTATLTCKVAPPSALHKASWLESTQWHNGMH